MAGVSAVMKHMGDNSPRTTSRAAARIQQAARKLIRQRHGKLNTRGLVERMALESQLMDGLRMIFLCSALFILLVVVLYIGASSTKQFHLRETYEDMFLLNELDQILSVPSLQQYLVAISARLRGML
eukprot:3932938-Rhodomonas_salina.1